MSKCSVCNGTGLVKKTQNKPKQIFRDYYSSSTQYGLYEECQKCLGTGIINNIRLR